MEQRPNPDILLKRIQEEEKKERRGKLKIYLGAAPGVGKTYSMLQDALDKRVQGLDIVIGIIESHGRREIDFLLSDFEAIPRQQVDYRGQKLTEFDLDAALKRSPGIILIDEMAHTNVPGLRHNKRWQDIKEILDQGIDVYTTLNVQHIESLNDVVSQIIHARVKETIPDSMLEIADTIELVDLPPEDLIKRLAEGKVYIPKTAELAAENFFRKGNLTALRELALRVTAERVSAQVLLYRQGLGIKHIWPTKEKILVCVGHTTDSTKLIRAARRIATKIQAEWIAVHVDTPRYQLSEKQRNRAIQNLRFAEQLGADTRILSGFDIVNEIITFAHEQNVTQIVVWKNVRSRFKSIFFPSLADEIVRYSGEINVYIVTRELDDPKLPKPPQEQRKTPWRIYGISLAIITLITLINTAIFSYTNHSSIIMLYILGVATIALFGEMGPSFLASLLSVFCYDLLFLNNNFDFIPSNLRDSFSLIIMFIVCMVVSRFAVSARRQTKAARSSQQQTATLSSLSHQLASTRGVDKLLETATHYIGDVFACDVIAILPEESHLVVRARYKTQHILTTKEEGIVHWVLDLSQTAGLGTDTLPFSDSLYIPLLASQGTIGAIRIHPLEPNILLTPEQMHLLERCANQIGLAIEVDRLQEIATQSLLQTEADRARSKLLQSVAHDLRVPLVAVMGATSTLMEVGDTLEGKQIKKLGKDMYFELEQLSRLITNLLQMTYLEAEDVKLQKEPCSLLETIHLVIKTAHKKLGKKPITINFPENLPNVPLDSTLIQEVFHNLIDNAIKYTSPDSPIEISAALATNRMIIKILDRGPGIMPDEVHQLFEKFYRGRKLTTERGVGLGLAICRSIVKAHGGEIWAENREGGGAAFCFSLPLQ